MDRVIDPYAPVPPPGQDELPCEDGEPMETPRHRDQMALLIETLRAAWADRDDFYVSGNMFVYYSELQSLQNDFRGPDVFVVLDTDGRKERKSWVAWQEGGQLPDIVIELLSDSTQATDRGRKKDIYERVWRTAHYVLFDPETNELEGFERVGGRYVPIEPDARGNLPITSAGLSLGVRPGPYQTMAGPWLRWIDPAGRPLATAAEVERERADRLQARVAELEAELAARR